MSTTDIIEEEVKKEEYIGPSLSEAEVNLGVEVRTFKFDKDSIDYKLLNITRPEQWEDAAGFQMQFEMPTPGGLNTYLWEIYGLSYKQYREASSKFEEPIFEPRPELSAKEQNALAREFESEKLLFKLKRQVVFIELATRKPIPGDTIDDKCKWLSLRNSGELEALYHYVADICTGLREGNSHELMKQIHAMSTTETKVITNFSDWDVASETQGFFRACRPFQDYVLQIPLKGITQKRKAEIEAECIYPAPPKKAGIDPETQRPSPKFMKENPKDPDYVRTCQAIEDKRAVLYFDECLPFTIPGGTLTEKRDWIGRKLAGDVIKLNAFIRNDLCGALTRYNFFTRGSGL